MGKYTILNLLHALIHHQETTDTKCGYNKEKLEKWAKIVVKSFREPFNGDQLDVIMLSSRRHSGDIPEDVAWDNVQAVKQFLLAVKVPKFTCKFNIPQVRTRLEKLMGTNYVSLTDRDYMQRLQERILEDYEEQMDKRIKVRQEEEMERVKNLVLLGKIPLDQAPPEMARHPIMLIENYCNKLIAERRAKIKIYKPKIPTFLYWDDTPDPPSGLSIESGHVFRSPDDRLCKPVQRHLEASEEDDIKVGYMMPPEEYDKVKYESSLVKRLMACETVEEMYALADDIIGVLKTIDVSSKQPDDNISETLAINS